MKALIIFICSCISINAMNFEWITYSPPLKQITYDPKNKFTCVEVFDSGIIYAGSTNQLQLHSPQSDSKVQKIARYNTPITIKELGNSYLISSDNQKLIEYDTSTNSQIKEHNTIDSQGNVSIYDKNRNGFIAADTQGALILQHQNLKKPVIFKPFEGEKINAVECYGSHSLACGGTNNITIFDLRNLNNHLHNFIADKEQLQDITILNQTLYSTGQEGLIKTWYFTNQSAKKIGLHCSSNIRKFLAIATKNFLCSNFNDKNLYLVNQNDKQKIEVELDSPIQDMCHYDAETILIATQKALTKFQHKS